MHSELARAHSACLMNTHANVWYVEYNVKHNVLMCRHSCCCIHTPSSTCHAFVRMSGALWSGQTAQIDVRYQRAELHRSRIYTRSVTNSQGRTYIWHIYTTYQHTHIITSEEPAYCNVHDHVSWISGSSVFREETFFGIVTWRRISKLRMFLWKF